MGTTITLLKKSVSGKTKMIKILKKANKETFKFMREIFIDKFNKKKNVFYLIGFILLLIILYPLFLFLDYFSEKDSIRFKEQQRERERYEHSLKVYEETGEII